jgi:predicted TIM-barrel fold metal-dependent hydrolase
VCDALGVEPGEEALLKRRRSMPFQEYARALASRANLAYLLLDEGYPPPDESYAWSEAETMLGVRVARILRIEQLVQDLIATESSLATVVERFDGIVSDLARLGFVGLKSIAAYRTGLRVEPVSEDVAEEAFEAARTEAVERGSLRLQSKPLVDYFVWRSIGHAAQQCVPVQFHTGYGDPDLDLRLANPLHLRPLFEEPGFKGAPIVLLHASYPYTPEAAYLAAVYANAYLDIAFSLPPLDWFALCTAVTTALGVAPASKILCSSDGTSIPEHYLLGATRARRVLHHVLTQMKNGEELNEEDIKEMGRLLLRDNALRIYRLEPPG